MRTLTHFALIWLLSLLSLSISFAQRTNQVKILRYMKVTPIKPNRDTLNILCALQEIERAINDTKPESLYNFVSFGKDTMRYTKVKNSIAALDKKYPSSKNSSRKIKNFKISDVQFTIIDTMIIVNFTYQVVSKYGDSASQEQTTSLNASDPNKIQSNNWIFKREDGNMKLVSCDKLDAILSSINNSNN